MPTFIKSGFWIKSKKQLEGYLNLDRLVTSLIPPSVPYKTFVAIIQQLDTNPPTFIVLENTLNLEIINSSGTNGEFNYNLNMNLPLDKTIINIGSPKPDAATGNGKFMYTVINNGSNLIILNTFQASASTWSRANFSVRNNLFEIRVYD